MSLHYVAPGDSTTVGVGDPMYGSSTTDLSGAGARPGRALLLTVRFHNRGQVFGLPPWLRRPLWQRGSVGGPET